MGGLRNVHSGGCPATRRPSTLFLSDDTTAERRADREDVSDASAVTRAARCDEHTEATMAALSGMKVGKHARGLAAALALGDALLSVSPGEAETASAL